MGNHFEDKKQAEADRIKRAKQEKVKEHKLHELIKKLYESKEGREYFLHLIEKTGIFKTSMTGNSTTFFNEGKRDVGLQVLSELTAAAPGETSKLFGEYYERRNNSSRTD